MDERERKLFHRAHYNILAARINEALIAEYAQMTIAVEKEDALEIQRRLGAASALGGFAIHLTKKLITDNSEFDPMLFLERCSDLTPIDLRESLKELQAINKDK